MYLHGFIFVEGKGDPKYTQYNQLLKYNILFRQNFTDNLYFLFVLKIVLGKLSLRNKF